MSNVQTSSLKIIPQERPAPDELVPSRYAVRVGDIDVLVISDGILTPPAESMATNADPEVRGAWLDDRFLSKVAFDWALNAVVVRSGDQTILTGRAAFGSLPWPSDWRHPCRLEVAFQPTGCLSATRPPRGGVRIPRRRERLPPSDRAGSKPVDDRFPEYGR